MKCTSSCIKKKEKGLIWAWIIIKFEVIWGDFLPEALLTLSVSLSDRSPPLPSTHSLKIDFFFFFFFFTHFFQNGIISRWSLQEENQCLPLVLSFFPRLLTTMDCDHTRLTNSLWMLLGFHKCCSLFHLFSFFLFLVHTLKTIFP